MMRGFRVWNCTFSLPDNLARNRVCISLLRWKYLMARSLFWTHVSPQNTYVSKRSMPTTNPRGKWSKVWIKNRPKGHVYFKTDSGRTFAVEKDVYLSIQPSNHLSISDYDWPQFANICVRNPKKFAALFSLKKILSEGSYKSMEGGKKPQHNRRTGSFLAMCITSYLIRHVEQIRGWFCIK